MSAIFEEVQEAIGMDHSVVDGAEPGGLPTRVTNGSPVLGRAMGLLIARGATLVLSFIFAVVIARVLQPSARGNFALLQTLNGLTVVAANFAIGGAAVFHIGKRIISPSRTASAATSLAFGSGALGAMLFIPVAMVLRDTVFRGIPSLLIVFAVLLATPLLLRDYLTGVMVAMGRPLRFMLSHAAQPLGALALLVPLAIFGSRSTGTVVSTWAVGILISGAVAIATTWTVVKSWTWPTRQDFFTLGRFGVRTYPALLARFLNLRFDQFLVAILASSAALGQYAVAVNVAELLFQIPGVILLAVSASISSLEKERSAILVTRACRWSLLLLAVLGIAVAVATPYGVPLVFGANYRPAIPSVLLLVPGMVLYAPAVIISEYFIIQRGSALRAALIPSTSLIVGASANLVLTPILGAVGASIASTVSYGAMFAAALFLFRSDSGQPISGFFRFSTPELAALLARFWQAVKKR